MGLFQAEEMKGIWEKRLAGTKLCQLNSFHHLLLLLSAVELVIEHKYLLLG